MTTTALTLLLIDTDGAAVPDLAPNSPFGPFACERCTGLAEAGARLVDRRFDVVVAAVRPVEARKLLAWPGLTQATVEPAMIVLTPDDPGHDLAIRLVAAGVQDVQPIPSPTDSAERLPRAVRLAIERKNVERLARKSLATDLMTGLPNQAQLVEHVNQLLALREREPAPMALLAVRVEGLATAEARLGREAANVLRRKIAVRLRMGLRASDVVASVGPDSFVVLLSKFQEAQDADRVAIKLREALHPPFPISGTELAIAVATGIAQFPADGRDAISLVRRATGLALAAPALGREGFANHEEQGPALAANELPPLPGA
jgi:diguanylate cyclase (GGDEF)-like protein